MLFDAGLDVVICRITSAARSGELDVPVTFWREAGLEKPSVIRLNRLVTAEKTLLIQQIGRLTIADAGNVKEAWNKQMILP